MADWCRNILRVCGSAEDVNRFKEKAPGLSPWFEPQPGQEPEPLNFHSLMPIPPEVLAAGFDAAGYDWESRNWGCKWGACHAQIVSDWDEYDKLFYEFDTAWSPPLSFMEHITKDWPMLDFVLEHEGYEYDFKGLARAGAGTPEDL